MFGRRKRQHAGARDPELPLGVEDAAALRSLLARTLAEAGHEAVIGSDHLRLEDGTELGLWNLAAMCADAPRREWPEIVRAHVAPLLDGLGPEVPSEDEVRTGIRERIHATDSLPDPSWFPSATALSDVLVSVPVIDTPTQVMTISEEKYDAVGGVARWREAGRAATRRLVDTEPLEHAVLDERTDLHVVMGDSFFTASLALHLPELMARFGVPDTGRGVVVAVPFRHQVAFHPVRGAESVEAINQLVHLAVRNSAECPGPVTPHLHLVRDGAWTRITTFDDQGSPGIVAGPELVAALEG